jgi:hypothetical protein
MFKVSLKQRISIKSPMEFEYILFLPLCSICYVSPLMTGKYLENKKTEENRKQNN